MSYLYKNKVDDLLKEKQLKSSKDLVFHMVEMFYNETITADDKKLLALAFKDKITQEDLDKLLTGWDIEAKGSHKSLILAYIMKENPHLTFSDYEGPRLKGLLNFYRFSNLKLIAHFTKYVKELNKHNITPLLIKGGAMKYLRQ